MVSTTVFISRAYDDLITIKEPSDYVPYESFTGTSITTDRESHTDENNKNDDKNSSNELIILVMNNLYTWLTITMSILSIIGSILMFYIYLTFKSVRGSKSVKMLQFLTLADMTTAIGNLIGLLWYLCRGHVSNEVSDVWCKFHSALTIGSSICSFLWTIAIALHLYIAIAREDVRHADKLTPLFHVVCWILPAVVMVTALGMNVLGYDRNLKHASWCWIEPTLKTALFWQYMSGKAWEVLACIATALLYIATKIYLKRQMKNSAQLFAVDSQANKSRQQRFLIANRKMTFVPVTFFLLRIWGTVRFLIGAHWNEVASKTWMVWIVPLQGIGDSAQGFANAILFIILTESIRLKMKAMICCIREPHVNIPSVDSNQNNRRRRCSNQDNQGVLPVKIKNNDAKDNPNNRNVDIVQYGLNESNDKISNAPRDDISGGIKNKGFVSEEKVDVSFGHM
ncbi:unnamed protein product [Owenia fusiformis]|uniref:Uncharacterized protein n=1 Tax=Owenia fusiformis TaxID=6347 RepID=A0A8J1UGB3_OWEFU|nr:unnamed protein product [Owenia fusiformis]